MNYETLQIRIKKLPKMQYFKVAFFCWDSVAKISQSIVVTHPSTPHSSLQFFKTFVTLPPNINDWTCCHPHPCPPTLTLPKNLECAQGSFKED